MLKEYTIVLGGRLDLIAEISVYAESEDDAENISWTKEEFGNIQWRDDDGQPYRGKVTDIQIIDTVQGPPRIKRRQHKT